MSFEEAPLRVALFLALVAFILQSVGVATPYWIINDFQGYTHDGLWKSCNGTDVCVSLSDAEVSLEAVRGLEVAAVVLIFLSMVPICLTFVMNADLSNLKKLKITAASVSFIAGILIYIGVAVYLTTYTMEPNDSILDHLSWAIWLCIAAGLLTGTAGAFVLGSYMRRRGSYMRRRGLQFERYSSFR